jgi:TonB family protein
MRSILVATLFVLFAVIAHAQESGVLYYDRTWAPSDEEDAMFVRRWERVNDTLYHVKDGYYSTGVLQMKGYSTDYREMRGKTGLFHYYHGNGKMSWEVTYANGLRHGQSQRWYPSGERSDSGTFTNGAHTGRWRYWHRNGTLRSEGEYQLGKQEGEGTTWYPNGQVETTGRYQKGLPVGVHKEYFSNGKIAGVAEYFAPGIGVAKWFDRDGTLRAEEQVVNDTIRAATYFTDNGKHNDQSRAEILPVPEGMDDMDELIEYIKDNLKYPELSRRNGHGGEVAITITIDEDGNLVDSYVSRSATETLDAEALRVLRQLTKWTQPRLHNREARITMTMPIIFKLED